MRVLFENTEPYKTYQFVRNGQLLWVEESGNPMGLPVLFLHGGPGSGCKPHHRGFFDPRKFRILLHDQRGCGQSIGNLDRSSNTTQQILEDLNFIQDALAIPKWLLFGGSWGATLALLYAEEWPSRVAAMVLRGAFLARERDLEWFIGGDGVCRIYPEAWRSLMASAECADPSELVKLLNAGLHGANESEVQRLALAWQQWGRVVTLGDATSISDAADSQHVAQVISQASIEVHYAHHRYFISENHILQNISRVSSIPARIIHGRRDLVCPPDVALSLLDAMPHAKLELLESAAHIPADLSMVSALIEATEEMAEASL